MDADLLTALRAPFPPDAIGKLPKPTRREAQKGNCQECGGYHGLPAVHLDFVGHADVTDRLLTVDPDWTWEPFALAPDGGPLIRYVGTDAEMWIRITIGGKTIPAVGTAPKNSFELSKQLISDAIRNGAMRSGVALDLWAKADLHESANPVEAPAPPPVISGDEADRIRKLIEGSDDPAGNRKAFRTRFGHGASDLPVALLDEANDWLSDLEPTPSPGETDG